MIRKEKKGMCWYEFEIFADCPFLQHAIFTSKGGFSTCPYSSLNLGEHVGDSIENVAKNQKQIADFFRVNSLFCMRQCHGKEICIVDGKNQNRLEGDSLVTQQPEQALMITHADCQAAIFYDPIHHALANVHSGWRGSVQNIYAETINCMRNRYGTDPKDLLVGISPSLGPQDAQFIHYRTELPEPFWSFQVKSEYFDFWEISKWQLQQSGVLQHHIEVANINTFRDQDFFSYRRNRITGRNGTIAMLKNWAKFFNSLGKKWKTIS